MKINFETISIEEARSFKKELEATIYERFDQLIIYADSEKFESHKNLNGKIIFSDDGLFYKTKEEIVGNDITLNEFLSFVGSKTTDELMNFEESTEDSITIDQLRNTLISLKNEKVDEIGDQQDIWIYIEAESNVNLDEIVDVLALLKFLRISHKSYQGKY